MRQHAELGAFAAQAGGDNQDLPRYPVGSPIRLAINLAGYWGARWGPVHGVTSADEKVAEL